MPGANTLAYLAHSRVTSKDTFVNTAPEEPNPENLYCHKLQFRKKIVWHFYQSLKLQGKVHRSPSLTGTPERHLGPTHKYHKWM
jgi:hypothetical protein